MTKSNLIKALKKLDRQIQANRKFFLSEAKKAGDKGYLIDEQIINARATAFGYCSDLLREILKDERN